MFEYLYNKNLVIHGSEIKTPPNNLNEISDLKLKVNLDTKFESVQLKRIVIINVLPATSLTSSSFWTIFFNL